MNSTFRNDHIEALIEQVLSEIETSVRLVSTESLDDASGLIAEARRIFIAGAGRSGLVMRALGIRLLHLGKTVYVVGEPTTPSIQATDLLIIGSGSGQTSTLRVIAQKAHNLGAKILLFTTAPDSPLADMADHTVVIPAPSLKDSKEVHTLESVQPMGTLFEQSLLIMCDSLVLMLMEQLDISADQMRERHANLE